MKINHGFTLAETLVTLGIIGVIAAIMLPAIKQAQPNQELVMLKKEYYNVTRIVGELINDEDYYPDISDDPNESGFANTDETPAIHGIRYGGDTSGRAQKFCGLFASKINYIGDNGNPLNVCRQTVSLANGGNFRTTDGAIWSMPVTNFRGGAQAFNETFGDINVDVNGPRGSNCHPGVGCINPDQFTIRILRSGRIVLPEQLAQWYVSTSHVNRTYNEFIRLGRAD